MRLRDGFTIEEPPVLVPWGIGERRLRELLPASHQVTDGYLTLEVTSLGGLRHMLGFHFEPRFHGILNELEFFHLDQDLSASYESLHRHLLLTFGQPTESQEGDEGFATHRWLIEGTEIRQWVFDRFGPELHVRIRWL